MPDYLTTRELSDLLRISERKIYDLAAAGDVPCVRAVGKLLFPRAEIMAWLSAARDGPVVAHPPLPPIIAGSHDPLLDWALRQSGAGLATYYDGSFDGLTRVAARSALAAGLHIAEAGGGWNVNSTRDALADAPVVLMEVAQRQRGLLLGRNVAGIARLADLEGRSLMRRQPSAASRRLLDEMLARDNITPAPITQEARTEQELALALAEGKAEAGFGLGALAAAYGLGFVPVTTERFDLLVWRRAYFDAPFQTLLEFLHGPVFADRASELGGYDLSGLGRIHFNGASG